MGWETHGGYKPGAAGPRGCDVVLRSARFTDHVEFSKSGQDKRGGESRDVVGDADEGVSGKELGPFVSCRVEGGCIARTASIRRMSAAACRLGFTVTDRDLSISFSGQTY